MTQTVCTGHHERWASGNVREDGWGRGGTRRSRPRPGNPWERAEPLKWTLDPPGFHVGPMGVADSGTYAGVAEEFLDVAKVSPGFEEMRGEGVAKHVRDDRVLS